LIGALLLNEIAPRPHNSGHHTIESCTPSQYTSHLYAVLSLPLPPITVLVPACAMLNLLGASSSIEDDFLRADGVARKAISLGASVHLYGKEGSRKGRKMGHVTVVGSSDDEVRDKIEQLVATLPPMYRHPVPTLPTPGRPGFSHAYPLVSVIMGSDSDLPVMLPATAILTAFNIPYELSIVSAHRTPARMVQFARTAESRGVRVVIAGAGGAAHLPGMVASETTLPVIGVPVRGSTALDGVDSLYSIVQMPVRPLLSSFPLLTH
jgi:phosphoribosylaminoimidazole carboxylase